MVTTISDPYNIGDYGGALSAGSGNAVMPSNYSSEGIDDLINNIASPTGFGQFLGGATDVLGGLLGGVQQIGSAISPAMPAIAGSLLTKEAYDRLSDIGTQSLTGVTVDGQRVPGAMEVAERGQRESQFRPFTVTTPTGSMFSARMGGQPSMGQPVTTMPVTSPGFAVPAPTAPPSMMLPPGMDQLFQMQRMPTGVMKGGIKPVQDGRYYPTAMAQQQPTTGGLEVGMTLSPQEQALQQQLLGGAGGFFGQAVQPTQAREQAIFERMRAAQRPEEERQRLALEERLAGQGRLGVSSAAYGGATPEMLAMATAQEEARNRSMLGAMQQAQAEQMQQAGLGQQFLGAGYIPQSQLLAAAQPGIQQQQLAQQAQQFGTGLFGETMMSGLEARLLAEQARANLLGGVGSNILAGMFTPQVNQRTGNVTSAGGLGDLGGLFGGIGEGLGEIGRAIGIID
jgi:hypothetical protein